jgi:hypothetical protein
MLPTICTIEATKLLDALRKNDQQNVVVFSRSLVKSLPQAALDILLSYACEVSSLELVDLLLKRQANPNCILAYRYVSSPHALLQSLVDCQTLSLSLSLSLSLCLVRSLYSLSEQ